MSTPHAPVATLLVIAALLGLAGCSESGGGSGLSGGVAYTGNADPADITKQNATRLGNAALSAEESSFVPFAESVPQPGSAGASALAQRLLEIYHEAHQRAGRKQSARVAPFETRTQDCSVSGRLVLTETENSAVFDFDACDNFFGLVIDGEVRAVGSQDDITITSTRLSIRANGLDITLGGTLRGRTLSPTESRVTLDFVVVDNLTGRQAATRDFVFAATENPDGSLEITVDGRVLDSVEGYVDVATAQTLVFEDVFANYPAAGQFVLTGNAGQRARVTAIDANTVRVELDIDPVDGVYETSQDFLWSELASGAPLD